MCLAEVWGDASAASGPRLRERFSILGCDPDDGFLARCLSLFLDKLNLRAERAALEGEPGRLADAGEGGEARLLSLWAAIQERTNELAERERLLADEAAALRRRGGGDGNQPPATTSW
jgi:hypothetical protein